MNNTSSTLATAEQQPLAAQPFADPYSVQQVLGQVALIQQIMAAAMKDGEHYGKIPGCGDKPTLLKPGAEKLVFTFRMTPKYDVDERQLDDKGNREYRVTCELFSIQTKLKVGEGLGTCSTLEAKYRYRGVAAEPTDRPVPRAYWDLRQEDPKKAQELIGGKGFTIKKLDGQGWMICKGGEKLENDNPADVWNTVLKMGKKRALVDAVLTATAASDIFTQDLEDITANMAMYPQASATELLPASAPLPRTKPAQATTVAPLLEDRDRQEVSAAANQNAPAATARPASLDRWEGSILDVKENSGKSKTTGKPWKLWTVLFERRTPQDEPTGASHLIRCEASTFSATIGERARLFGSSNEQVVAGIQPGKKQGWELMSLETAESVAAAEEEKPMPEATEGRSEGQPFQTAGPNDPDEPWN